jgi:hypothetical protein
LDYYTSGGTAGCPALLVEPSAQNVLLQSEAFNTSWTPVGLNAFGSGSVANSTGTTDPFGGTNSDYIQETAASGTHVILQTAAGQVSGTTVTLSCFAKSAERTQINFLNNGGGLGNATFNLTAGTATLVNGVSASIQNYGNGWYRCALTYTPSVSGNFNVQVRLADASGNTSYTGTGTSGLYVFGAQLETGSIATSYIPTTTAPVTRNADVINVSSVSGVIGQTEGTIYVEVDMSVIPQLFVPCAIDIGTVSEYLVIGVNSSGAFRVLIKKATGSQTQLMISSANPVGVYKIAVAYKNGDYAMSINGATPLTSNDSTNYPVGAFSVVHLSLSAYGIGICRTRTVALYPARLTNTELQALTA